MILFKLVVQKRSAASVIFEPSEKLEIKEDFLSFCSFKKIL